MTVKQLRALIKGLPGDMDVLMPLDDENLVSVCAENSTVVLLGVADYLDDIESQVEALLLVGCTCHSEGELEPIINEDQLN